jgi:hypothetical protein
MQTRGKFILMTLAEFEAYIRDMDITKLRKINHVQTHHTWSPSYRNFNGANHFDKMESMEADHIARGFGQIAQHYTTFPDGTIVAGRGLNSIPTCIYKHNTGGICIENLGNFDKGQDNMTPQHRDTIIRLNALLCLKFNLGINTTSLIYHHWFRMDNGVRDDGMNDPKYLNHKTCPGTGFFGGNKVDDANANFIPAVNQAYLEYKNIAGDASVQQVKKGKVNTALLNVRSGAGTDFPVIDQLKRDTAVDIFETQSDWDRIGPDRWVASDYIALIG